MAKDATHASIKAGMTVTTMQKIGVKKIAKRIAKRTAMGLAKSYIAPGHSSGTSHGSNVSSAQALQDSRSKDLALLLADSRPKFHRHAPDCGMK